MIRSRVRGCAVNAVLFGITLFVCLMAAELIVRQVRPRPLEAASMWPDGTLRHIPSFSHVYARPGFSNRVSYNALGLRGPDVPPEPDVTVPRVLFLGDSFVEGKQVGDSKVLTAVLSDLARGAGHPLEVINAGVSGYGTAEEILLWDRLGTELRPDLVLLGFYPNDVRNNADRGLFVLREGRAIPGRPPSRPKVRWVYDTRKWLAARSHLYMLFTEGLDLLDRPVAGDSVPLEAEDVFAREPPARVAEGWDLTLALLDDLRARVESTGARFAVVVFPTRFQVDDQLWADLTLSRGMDPAGYDLAIPQRKLEEWAGRSGGALLDLLPTFRAARQDGGFYHAVDAHWNEAGHRLAAEAIYAGLDLPTFTRAGRSTVSPSR
ncbi:MAG: alginate O-acetyltransferase AlgX-related protein [Candidatus Polarisedimenticolia bacterium]